MCIASSHISVTVDLVTDTVVFLFEKKKMQIGEVALKKLKGYNNLHFLSKTKHKGARVFLLFFFPSFYIPFGVIVHLYNHACTDNCYCTILSLIVHYVMLKVN